MSVKRIIELETQDSIGEGDYIPVDSQSGGTKKYPANGLGGGGNDLFVVNITLDDGSIETVDKTYAEIVAAHNAGKYIYAMVDGAEWEFGWIDTEDQCAYFRTMSFYWDSDRIYEWQIGIGANSNIQHYYITDSADNIAPEFSTVVSYNAGQYCRRDGTLYRFTSNHSAGAWNSNHVTAVTVGGELTVLKSDIGDLSELETTAKTDLVSAINEAAQSGGSGLTSDIKQALLQLAAKVSYVDDDGQDYYDDLHDALYVLSSISAVYTQSGTVYDTDSLDSLKTDLVVTAHYDDQSTETVTSYTLSGTLSTGTSTITVSYGGKTTTFNVTVTHATTQYTITNTLTHVSNSNNATEINAQASYSATLSADSGYVISSVAITMGGTDITSTAYNSNTKAISIASVTGNIVITATASESAYQLYDTIMANSLYTYNTDNAIYLPDYVTAGDIASLDELQVEFEMQLQSTPSSTMCVLGASNTGGSSELGGLKFMISSGGLGLYSHNVNVGSVYGNFNDVLDLGRHIVKYVNTNVSPFTYYCDNSSKEVSWTTESAYTPKLGLSFCNQTNGTPEQVAKNSIVKIGYIKLWDKNGNLLNHFAPAVRKSDNFVGMYDADKDVFVTANQNTRYTCGTWTATS